MKKHWPLLCLFCTGVLFVLGAANYPGGTNLSADTIGYDWSENTISALFQPNALNGTSNPARYYAIPAMFIYFLSLVFIFRLIAQKAASKFHRKTIEIAGIGFAIYAFLVVTPMHNLMVSIALLFFIATVLTILHDLYLRKRMLLLMFGLFSISLPLINAAMYYGDFLYGMLPILQKSGAIACAIWFVALYYAETKEHSIAEKVLHQ